MEFSASILSAHISIINIDIFLILIICLSATLYYCYAIYSAIVFSIEAHHNEYNFHPPVTILKPICGLERDIYENLASCCQQNYPVYQIIFCVHSSQDLAINVVKQIIADFPAQDIQLVVCAHTVGINLKVSNLANGAYQAKHNILLIADSDIRVGKDYLQRVIQPFQDESVGVVTCLYRSLAKGWIETLEAIGTACQLHATSLAEKELEGMKSAFGSTVAIRKNVLKAVGGFEAIADYLADDFQLGYLPAKAGYKVVLCDYIVEHVLSAKTVLDSIHRQIRWLQCVRVSGFWSYLGLIFTYGNVISLILLVFTHMSLIILLAVTITWLTRFIMGWYIGAKILDDASAKKYLWLIPLWDFISFIIWCYCFFCNTIEWRGLRFMLIKNGKMLPLQKVRNF